MASFVILPILHLSRPETWALRISRCMSKTSTWVKSHIKYKHITYELLALQSMSNLKKF